jgi:hypothetical protein
MKELLSYGRLRDSDKLIHIEDAENGKKCNCVCSWCGETLIARQGESNAAHFAHASERDCEFAGESALHLLAKDILFAANYIILPDRSSFRYSQAEIEKSLAAFRPDAILKEGDDHLHVEVFVTHKTGFHKQRFFYENGLNAIEIDLSQIDRSITREELRKFIIDEITTKYFLCTKQEPVTENAVQVKIQKQVEVVPVLTEDYSKQHPWYATIWNVVGIGLLITFLFWVASILFSDRNRKGYYRY